jgi:hypothetical protein
MGVDLHREAVIDFARDDVLQPTPGAASKNLVRPHGWRLIGHLGLRRPRSTPGLRRKSRSIPLRSFEPGFRPTASQTYDEC